MSVTRIHPRSLPSPPDVVQVIADELRRNRPDGPTDSPQIVEEEVAHSKSVFVTVVWDGWHQFPKDVRGRAILDAYKQVRPEEVPNISMVLGLTQAEAARLGGVPRFAGGSRDV